MRIRHIALNVRDPQRSERFYLDEIGLAGTATVEEWGVRLRLDDGFMMALIEGEPLPSTVVDRVHFGCHLPDAESVHRVRARLSGGDVPEVDWTEEPGYCSVKVRDPDGYVVELAWDVQ
ncbi:MAG TPA: VOC family protein [Acidimicrobiia bacterium]|jgi:catechol 2,3-dioxygenase-like lactoylglutathione lyase family enzyme